jgi:DNA-binding transcriptional ArsR family regulator
MADQSTSPDYELDDVLYVSASDQLKAIADPTRQRILSYIGERAATTKQLAERFHLPKGTVGHHLKSLEHAGLIKVVRTRQVRAITEKYYGRVARLFLVSSNACAPGEPPTPIPREIYLMPLTRAISEFAPADDPDDPTTFLISHARVPQSRAKEFANRLQELAKEFGDSGVAGERMYGLVAGVYLTDDTSQYTRHTQEDDNGSQHRPAPEAG